MKFFLRFQLIRQRKRRNHKIVFAFFAAASAWMGGKNTSREMRRTNEEREQVQRSIKNLAGAVCVRCRMESEWKSMEGKTRLFIEQKVGRGA
jgi:hypothetical protein